MSTEKQIASILSAAGNFLHSLPIIKETDENGNSRYHCQWQHEKGTGRKGINPPNCVVNPNSCI